MKRLKFENIIIIVLIAASVLFFLLQQFIFQDFHSTFFYILQDMIFLPLNILFVTFILNKIIVSREKRIRLEHMNMVIGAFFSEAGTAAIDALNPYMSGFKSICSLLDMKPGWSDGDFVSAAQNVKSIAQHAKLDAQALGKLSQTLPPKRDYVLQMFSNPNLLEHDTFTDMLWALYHLIDEIQNRADFSALPESDIEHMANDAVRSYRLLVYEWVIYMKHLKKRYPYLWSLASRKNPFASNSVIISE